MNRSVTLWQATLLAGGRVTSTEATARKAICSPEEFAAELDEEFARAERYDRPLGLVMLAVDDLEQWVERHGASARDAMLESVGALCRRTLRRHDVFTRHGDEDFAALLVETGEQGAAIAANRLRAAIAAAALDHGGLRLSVTASVGVVTLPHLLVSKPTDMLALAAAALYDARQSGGDRVVSAL